MARQLFPHANARGRFRTLSNALGHFRPHASRSEHGPTPRPHLITGTLGYAFGNKQEEQKENRAKHREGELAPQRISSLKNRTSSLPLKSPSKLVDGAALRASNRSPPVFAETRPESRAAPARSATGAAPPPPRALPQAPVLHRSPRSQWVSGRVVFWCSLFGGSLVLNIPSFCFLLLTGTPSKAIWKRKQLKQLAGGQSPVVWCGLGRKGGFLYLAPFHSFPNWQQTMWRHRIRHLH